MLLAGKGHSKTVKHVIKSPTGTTLKAIELYEPPNPKAAELILGRIEAAQNQVHEENFNIFQGWFPLLKQGQFLTHFDYNSEGKPKLEIVYLQSGIGYGKSKALVRKAILLAYLNRGLMGMLVAPTYKVLSTPIRDYLLETLFDMKIPYKINKSENYVELWGNTKIILRSFDNPENLRGPNLAWICADEMRQSDKYGFDIMLGRVRDPKAMFPQFAITSTPEGFDYLYDVFYGDNKLKNAVVYKARTKDNIYLQQTTIDALYEAYDERVAKQELEGECTLISAGQIYYQFDRQKHLGDYPYDPALPILIGQDFNYNPMCCVICQAHKNELNEEELWVVDELYMMTSSTDDLCKELKARGYGARQNQPEWVTVYPDASGAQKTAASGQRSNLTIMESYGFTNLKHRQGNPRILDRYNSVNGLLCNANGKVRLKINSICKKLAIDFEREQYKTGSQLRDDSTEESKMRGHLADGLGYLVHYRNRLEPRFIPYATSND